MPNLSLNANSDSTRVFKYLLLTFFLCIVAFLSGIYYSRAKYSILSTHQVVNSGAPSDDSIQKDSYKDGYQAALQFAREKISSFGIGPSLNPNSIRGVVKSIDQNQIKVDIPSSFFDLFAEGMTEKVLVPNDKTFFEKQTVLTADQLGEEKQNYEKSMTDLNNQSPKKGAIRIEPASPQPIYSALEKFQISDIKVGDQIQFTTLANIQNKNTFDVSYIKLIPKDSVFAPAMSVGESEAPLLPSTPNQANIANPNALSSGNIAPPTNVPTGENGTPPPTPKP